MTIVTYFGQFMSCVIGINYGKQCMSNGLIEKLVASIFPLDGEDCINFDLMCMDICSC